MWRRDRGAACHLVALANSCLVHVHALIPWITLSKPCRKGSLKQGEGHKDKSLLWDEFCGTQFTSLLVIHGLAYPMPLSWRHLGLQSPNQPRHKAAECNWQNRPCSPRTAESTFWDCHNECLKARRDGACLQ